MDSSTPMLTKEASVKLMSHKAKAKAVQNSIKVGWELNVCSECGRRQKRAEECMWSESITHIYEPISIPSTEEYQMA